MRTALAAAEQVLTSDLTLVECDRALLRAQASRRLGEGEVTRRRKLLEDTAGHWTFLPISSGVVERARRAFPGEPLRTLDALHLATALATADTLGDLTVLSLDQRLRGSAHALGLRVTPEE